MNNIQYSREANYNSNIILVDGFSGTGKSLTLDLLNAFNGVEISHSELILKALKYKYKEDILEKFLSEVLSNSFRGRYMEPLIDKKGILNMKNINNLILQIKKIYT